ncbi:MAG: hypothetical protein ACI9LM_003845 [Alteromonadaceae bacterium]|jgi:hypothetical protein
MQLVFFAFRRENQVYPVQQSIKQKNATISNNEYDIPAISIIKTVCYYAVDMSNIRAKNFRLLDFDITLTNGDTIIEQQIVYVLSKVNIVLTYDFCDNLVIKC